MSDWIDEREKRHQAAEPVPWPLPDDRVAPSPHRGRNYDERLPLDHEGCDVWPWNTEDNMILAYENRNEEPRVLAVLKAARALVAEGEPTITGGFDLGQTYETYALCGGMSPAHEPDCRWQALVAALAGAS